MIVNKDRIPYITAHGIQYLNGSDFIEIRDFSLRDYWALQFLTLENTEIADLDAVIPGEVLDKIRDGRFCLCLANHLEAFHGTVDKVYDLFVQKLNVDPRNILLLTHSPNITEKVLSVAAERQLDTLRVCLCRTYERMAAGVEIHEIKSQPRTLRTRLPSRRFLCLNRRWRPHRATLVALLISRGLIDQGWVSLSGCEGWSWPQMQPWIEHLSRGSDFEIILENLRETLAEYPDLLVDTSTQDQNLDALTPSLADYYNDTWFSVITETPYYTNRDFDPGMHISEKTFKAISQRHPFVMVNVPGSLKALRELGYKTFHPYINEDYDLVQDDNLRMSMIINEIQRLCNINDSVWTMIDSALKNIVEYNYQHLIKDYNKLGRYSTDLI